MLPTDLTPVARLWLERQGEYVLGEREVTLLAAIEQSRSIKEGAHAAGVSYRTAWACLRTMAQALRQPVVQSRAGGLGGGETTLTEDTRALIRLYTELSRRVTAAVEREFQATVAVVPS